MSSFKNSIRALTLCGPFTLAACVDSYGNFDPGSTAALGATVIAGTAIASNVNDNNNNRYRGYEPRRYHERFDNRPPRFDRHPGGWNNHGHRQRRQPELICTDNFGYFAC